MDSLASVIDIEINPGRSLSGAAQVNSALDSIIARGGRVTAANDNAASSLGRLGKGAQGASGHAGALSKILDDVKNRAAGATPAVGGLISSLMRLGPMAAIIGAVALGIGAIGAAAIKAGAQTQQWMAQLETTTKSSQKAQESYAALVNFASRTPFDLGQSIDAFTKLRNLGLAATEERLTSFGNTAAAMGKGMNQMIEAVADASTGEFERLKEFGIKSKTEGDKVAFTFQGVTTKVGKNSTEIVKYLEKIGQTQFAGAMAKQMDTLKGAFSNISDNFQQFLSAIGTGALGNSVKEIAKSIANGISLITPFAASIGNLFGSIIGAVGSVLNGLGQLWAGFGGASAATTLLDGLTFTFNLLGQGVQVVGSIVGSVFGFIGGLASNTAALIGGAFGELLSWMGVSFESGGRSWGNSIVGILRAVKAVVSIMPQLFSVAIGDIMKMFRSLGSIVGRLLSGDLSALKDIGASITGSFANTAKAIGAAERIAKATYRDEKGASAAIDRMLGRSGKAKLDAGTDAKAPPASGKKDGKSEAEKLAEKIDDFWKKLEGDSKDAQATYDALAKAATEGKSLAVASADTAKQLEFQRLAGRDITEQESKRIANALQQQRTSKFLSDTLVAAEQRKFDLASETALLELKRKGLNEGMLEVEKGVIAFRTEAQKQGVDLQSEAYKSAEAKLRIDLASAEAVKAQNKAYDEQAEKLKQLAEQGKSVIAEFSASGRLQSTLHDLDEKRKAADAYYAENKGKPGVEQAYKEAITGISQAALEATTTAKTQWIDAVDQIASHFKGKFGEVVDGIARTLQNIRNMGTDRDSSLFGGIANLFGGGVRDSYNENAQKGAGGLLGALTNPMESLSKGFDDFKGMFTSSGAGGFASILGKGLAKAGMGAEIGSAIGGIGKALGLKGFNGGAQIGGTIGGLFGPIGGAIGSLLGGTVGALLHKTPRAASVITSGTASSVTGNKGSYRDALTGNTSSIQSGLYGVASQLGGDVGNFLVSIGLRGKTYRVSSTGAANVDAKKKSRISGLTYVGKDEGAAIAAAMKDAILDGAITGVSQLVQKTLQHYAGDIDKAVDKALQIKSFETSYKELFNPIQAAVDAINDPLLKLRETMLAVGASTTDLTKLDEYRSAKLKEVLKDQVSGFQDLLDQLNGDAGGVSDFAQLQTGLTKLNAFRTDMAAGKQIDQSAYTSLAQDIIDRAGASYGVNTAEYQNIVGLLKTTTTDAITVATNAFNNAGGNASTTDAIKAQTNAYVAQQQQTNVILNQQLTVMEQVLAALRGNRAPAIQAQNSRLVMAP